MCILNLPGKGYKRFVGMVEWRSGFVFYDVVQ